MLRVETGEIGCIGRECGSTLAQPSRRVAGEGERLSWPGETEDEGAGMMEKFVFKLDCGEEVYLGGLHCKISYDRMSGHKEEVAKHILEYAPNEMDDIWFSRKKLMIPFELNARNRTIPRWQIHAMLRSNTIISDEDADGSKLEVIFFRKEIFGFKIEDLIFEAVRSIDWRAHADDWWAL